MLQLFEVFILAIVQGITEFLPVSSSGHLVLIENLMARFGEPLATNGDDFIKLNILLHVGTLGAVLVIFHQHIGALFGQNRRLILPLIIATIPAVIVGFTIKKLFPELERSLFVTGGGFLITAVLLLSTMKRKEGTKSCRELGWWDALLIGLTQAVAVLPGISRSGSTIVAGLSRGLKRDDAAVFSFLMAIPVIAGVGLLEFIELVHKYNSVSDALANLMPPTLIFGVAVSFISGAVALIWLIHWLRHGNLYMFAVWVLLLSPLAFGLAFNPPHPKGRDIDGVPIQVPDERNDNNSDNSDNSDAKHSATTPAVVVPSNVVNEPDDTDDGELTRLSNMTDEERAEAIREVERIIEAERVAQAEQDAREIAAPPLVDDETKLVKLDPTSRIWVEKDDDGRRRVIVLGVVVLRDKPIELFACRRRSKEHESIVALNVKPNLIHAALLLTGAKPGKPVEFMPKFVPPSGEKIDVRVRWLDADGKRRECPATDWIAMSNEFDEVKQDDGSVKKIKRTMNTHWVFTGSTTFQDNENVTRYVADETGEIIGTSNFVGSILDVPIESSDQNSTLMFEANTERIPPLGTPVTLVLEPEKK